MPYFRTEKVTRNRTNVYDVATGELVCPLLAKEVDSWLRRTVKAIEDEAAYKI